MKLFCALALFAASLSAAGNPQLRQVHFVYILSMTNGIDQFLANRLTTLGVFEVVADPQKADAIITDRLGEPFENKLRELYPPPPPPPAAEDEDDKGAKATQKDKDSSPDFSQGGGRVSSFGRSKGNFFVVDRKSRSVLWSIYERPRDSSPAELNHTADKVARRLKNDLSDKKQE